MRFRRGHLSDHFRGVGAKRLALVDTLMSKSNQHEVTGSTVLRAILGETERKLDKASGHDGRFEARYIWLGAEQEAISEVGRLSWYDSRRNKRAKRDPEWRLYYQHNPITDLMKPGDSLFTALRADDTLLFIVAPGGSTMERQLVWLFGLPDEMGTSFSLKDAASLAGPEIDFAARLVLDELGEELEEDQSFELDRLLRPFKGKFPPSATLAALARSSLAEVEIASSADTALTLWLEREEQLFRRLERHAVSSRLSEGFMNQDEADVDGFLAFSMSVQNRRKSRMGLSLEHHLEFIFQSLGLRHMRGARTEGTAKPDFLFPGQAEYADRNFDPTRLLMLGAKSTCKDRWRQVLAEAARIPNKHLLTLEPSISENQTAQMRQHFLQLVVPRPIHPTYSKDQQRWLMSLDDFIGLAKRLQH